MTTPTAPRTPRWRLPAFGKVAPVLVALGSLLVALVIVLTHPSRPGVAAEILTASGSNGVPVGNGNSNGNIDPNTGCNTNGNCVKSFGVTVGNVTGLYPGLSTTIPVTYTNPNAFPIYVTTATATASGPTACDGNNLIVGTKTMTPPGLLVDKNASRFSSMPLTLKSTTTDACKGASWTITVTAQAVK